MAAAAQPGALSSTSQFFLDFFPTAHARLSQRYPALWARLQPAWLAQHCAGEQTLRLGSLAIRNAELLPWQLAGVAVAAAAAATLRGHRFAYFRHALLFFGGMNVRQVCKLPLALASQPLVCCCLMTTWEDDSADQLLLQRCVCLHPASCQQSALVLK